MPRPVFPPTPGSSTDIKGMDGAPNLNSDHISFELPPPAIHDTSSSTPPIDANVDGRGASHPPSLAVSPSPRATYSLQAAETVKSRRLRSSVAKDSSSFTLPPPPTRSRKIIQMKPRAQQILASAQEAAPVDDVNGKDPLAVSEADPGNWKKTHGIPRATIGVNPVFTTAASRKTARRTAHSEIEKRRRSKMNEEFAVLKEMIPACIGEMHKLSILQASIDYVRYLEDCVAKLKAQHAEYQSLLGAAYGTDSSPVQDVEHTFIAEDPASRSMDTSDSDTASPMITELSNLSSTSPAIQSVYSDHQQQSRSSGQGHNNSGDSAGTSTGFESNSQSTYAQSNASGSTLTSPALNPHYELAQEATAALLMLNKDRRGTPVNGKNVRGLSIQDLLSI